MDVVQFCFLDGSFLLSPRHLALPFMTLWYLCLGTLRTSPWAEFLTPSNLGYTRPSSISSCSDTCFCLLVYCAIRCLRLFEISGVDWRWLRMAVLRLEWSWSCILIVSLAFRDVVREWALLRRWWVFWILWRFQFGYLGRLAREVVGELRIYGGAGSLHILRHHVYFSMSVELKRRPGKRDISQSQGATAMVGISSTNLNKLLQ